jgi:hypothetical protein
MAPITELSKTEKDLAGILECWSMEAFKGIALLLRHSSDSEAVGPTACEINH